MEQQQMVAEIATESISAMGISQDNRLLIWGSERGEVHVWGVRAEGADHTILTPE